MDKIYLIAFYIFKFFIFITPNFLQDLCLRFLCFLYMRINKRRFKIVMTNLDLAFENSLSKEQKKEIAKKTYLKFAKYLGINFINNQNTNKEKVLSKVSFENLHFLEDAIKLKRPIITTTAHYGDWELFALAVAAKFGSVSVVGRKLDSESMDKILSKNRTQFNIELIEKNNAAKEILKSLKNGKILGILVDQNTAKSEGIEVSFFGKKVLHTPAATILAQKTNAVIIPAFIRNDGEKSKICFLRPIEINNFKHLPKDEAVTKITQLQADATEKFIREKPEEYFWFHRRFKHFYEELYR